MLISDSATRQAIHSVSQNQQTRPFPRHGPGHVLLPRNLHRGDSQGQCTSPQGNLLTHKKWTYHRYETASIDVDIDSPDAILDERTGIYVTSVPGAARWLDPASLETLSLEDMPAVLRGDKDRVVSAEQHEIGVVVKCYSGIENTVKVCDLIEVIGILEVPEADEEDGHVDVVIHAVTLKKKRLDEIVLSTRDKLSQRRFPPNLFIISHTSLKETISPPNQSSST